MRSIETRPPLTLSHRRAEIVGFWVVAGAICALSFWSAAAAARLAPAWRWALGGVALLVAPGVVWRPWFGEAIRVWNGMSWRVAALFRRYVLLVTYYVLIAPLGAQAAREAAPERQPVSGWVPIGEAAPGTDAGRSAAAPPHGGWRHDLRTLSDRPGREWVAHLWPMVYLLNLFADEYQETAPPSGTYTLY